jgi:hypothetical protein
MLVSGDALLLIDTDRIKSYVFASPYLRDIRGGSALLDRLNREDIPKIVATLAPGSLCIYANGGTGLFAVPADVVNKVAEEAAAEYAAAGASATSAWVPVPEGWSRDTDLGPQLRLLAHRMRVAKDERPSHAVLASSPFLRPCEACGVEYSRRLKRDRRRQRLCPACLTRREHRTEATWAEDLRKAMGPELGSISAPDDFEDIAEASQPGGYIGLIYADGNSMGQRIAKINRLSHFQAFSGIVDTSLKEAVGQALRSHLKPQQRKTTSLPCPFEVLMLGGDDLVMVTRAQSALDTALTTVEEFERLTGEKLQSRGLSGEEWAKPVSLSAAVVISHSHFPFGSLLHLAETALKAAKRDGARASAAATGVSSTARINFLVVSSSNHQDFDDYYDSQLRRKGEDGRELFLTARPYSPSDLKNLLTETRRLARLPPSRIQQFREACYMEPPLRAKVEALATLARMKKEDRDLVWEALTGIMGCRDRREFPWFPDGPGDDSKRRTPFVDIAELLPFVKPQEVGERNGR